MIRTSLLIAAGVFWTLAAFGASVAGVSFIWLGAALIVFAAAFSDGFPFHWSKRAPVWAVALCLLGGSVLSASTAKPPKSIPAAVTHRFEEFQDPRGDWRWRVRASNDLIVAAGTEGYRNRNDMRTTLRNLVTAIRTGTVEGIP